MRGINLIYQKVINWPRRAEKVGAGFRPQKGVWLPLAASQTLCLPHPWVGKIALLNLLLVTATGAPPHGGEMRQFIFPAFSFTSRRALDSAPNCWEVRGL